ncbi:class I glutamine amidotransferase-like protein [Gloeophyllum trabeum ATCC 11539]|uniref:Class I glutamine amidotransferase-like protein n=1 Tax=Gloeophyllum trabeum (strain ATCC 11539 / FP-39264 / Madison 617) TaxID=670483 RepID=S7RR65_GLOTA|nr:class I glutamine amidotransferase-like protein [Gloeophyllum trabeum ATCC 11539]EPQ55414.1 class I glutamine amidotransferase-like protein [Gloeophyllum trabeum ATCC 11539]
MSQYNIAVLLYPGADALDFTGPVEIFSAVLSGRSLSAPAVFHSTTFALASPVTAASGPLTLTPNATLVQVRERLEDFDVLVVPGAGPQVITDLITSEDGKQVLDLIKRFAGLEPRSAHRVLLSVCTGSVILGAAGVLGGKEATTHHMFYDMLSEVSAKAGGKVELVKERRWVDAGFNEAGVRIVTAGGVSSGMDASLYVVEKMVGKDAADLAGEIVEFESRQEVVV